MSSKELLCALWTEDHGDECPNPEMSALLDKYSLPTKSKIPNSLGMLVCYIWFIYVYLFRYMMFIICFYCHMLFII